MTKKITVLFSVMVTILLAFLNINDFNISYADTISKNENSIWLSEIEYNKQYSSFSYNGIKYNTNSDGKAISLLVDGEIVEYDKGVAAHAPSIVIYDISQYSDKYTRFVTQMGVDYSMRGGVGDGVQFKISKSNDFTNWTVIAEHTTAMKGEHNSKKIDVDVAGAKYLKLEAIQLKNNSRDHSIYADARLVKKDYKIESEYSDIIKPASYYDEILSTSQVSKKLSSDKLLILQREFVNRIGYHTLQSFDSKSEANKALLNWLVNDKNALELYISGGKTEGSASKSLQVLSDLYAKHDKDVENNTYLKMMLATSLAFGQDLRLWTGGGEYADPVERYEIFKDLYNDKLLYNNKMFDNLPVELMRWVFNAQIDNDEIKWLNAYARKFGQTRNKEFEISPHPYMKYTSKYNYNRAEYYSLDNFKKYDEKFDLAKYGVKYGTTGDNKLWMVILEGAVCGGISKIGANLQQVFGLPSAVIGQPGHAAFLVYSEDENGNGKWGIDNNISGWIKSEKSERAILNWGSQSWDSYYGVSYTLLAQNALNNYNDYLDAMYYNLLANSYSSVEDKIKVYEEGIKILPYHVDMLVSLINQYKAAGKSSSDFLKLAKKVSEGLSYFPLPFADIMKLIEPNLTSTDMAEFDLIRSNTLKAGTLATSKSTLQYKDCINMAKGLLGSYSVELATFSFDGEKANKIVINDKYDSSNLRFSYSIDGGKKWNESTGHVIQLNQDEISKITAEDDIKIKLVGSEEIYSIDIQRAAQPNINTVYSNDFENEYLGNLANLEYSLDGGNTWKDYVPGTKIEGYVVTKARYAAHGTYLQSEMSQYTFKENVVDPQYSYISIHDIDGVKYANEQNVSSSGKNMVDGKLNTQWHTKWHVMTKDKSYTIILKDVRDISAVDYIPAGVNGMFTQFKVEVSMDNENWKLAGTTGTLAKNSSVKSLKFDKSEMGKYVKITPLSTYGNSPEEVNMYASGYEFRLYEDLSGMEKFVEPTVEYSTVTTTNKDVSASLKITEGTVVENGNSFVFSENGEHTFNYIRPDGTKGSIVANVNWIDKTAPAVNVTYSLNEASTKLIASLELSEEGRFLNGVTENNTVEFSDNGSKVISFEDLYGNVDQIVVKCISFFATENNTANKVRFVTINGNIKYVKPEVMAILTDTKAKVVNGEIFHKFTENGTHIFEIEKADGTIEYVGAKVTSIPE